MTPRAWLATSVLSAGWLYFLPLTEPKNEAAGLVFLLAAVGVLNRVEIPGRTASWPHALLWGVAALAAGLLLPFPFGLALLLPGLACLLRGVPVLGAHLSGRLCAVGLGCALLDLLTVLWWQIAPRVHTLSVFAAPATWLARALGLDAALSGGALYVPVEARPEAFVPSLESLGGFYFAGFALLGICGLLFFTRCNRLRVVAVFSGVCLLYVVLRYAVLAGLYAELWSDEYQSDLYWRHLPVILSFLPLTLLAAALPGSGTRSSGWLGRPTPGAPAWSLGLYAAAGFLLAFGLLYQDPGTPKKGRVLIDEAHSDWEWTSVPYDTETFGHKTLYNYSELHRYLGYYYEPEALTEAPLNAESLASADVLILKTPTRPYTNDEIEAVRRFVREGGGLLLVGDHTNVFGMNTYLNQMAEPYGFAFRSDSTKDLTTGNYTVYRPLRLTRHPALAGVQNLQFRTSCTLAAGFGTEAIITGHNTAQDHPDYGVHNFFGDFKLTPSEGFGLYPQMVGKRYGRGRVIAFTDSTIYSNFALFLPGISESVLGSIEWLNRTNSRGWLSLLSLLAGFACAAAAVAIGTRGQAPGMLPTLTTTALAIALALRLAYALTNSAYPVPEPHTNYPQIAFDRSHSAYELPIVTHPHDDSSQEYLTFYLWSQKLGLVPRVTLSVEEGASQDAIVFINPLGEFSRSELRSIDAYLESGGGVLILDSPDRPDSSSAQITRPHGLGLESVDADDGELEPGEQPLLSSRAGRVIGGDPLVTLPDGRVLAAGVMVGKGRLILVADTEVFSNAYLGSYQRVPDTVQLERSDLAFALFEELVESR